MDDYWLGEAAQANARLEAANAHIAKLQAQNAALRDLLVRAGIEPPDPEASDG